MPQTLPPTCCTREAAAWAVLIFTVSGVYELVKHRREVLDELSPTAREVSKLRR